MDQFAQRSWGCLRVETPRVNLVKQPFFAYADGFSVNKSRFTWTLTTIFIEKQKTIS